MKRSLTWANGLTALRLFAAPVLVAAIHAERPLFASGVFFFAVGTDIADGWVARRFAQVTPFGGFIDHAVDATFVCAGTAALAVSGVLPAVLPAMIAVAFVQYAADSGNPARRSLRPSALGRWNGIAYYAIVAVPIVRDALGLEWPGAALVSALGWLLVGTTGISMADRLRRVLRSRTDPGSPV